jgi:hypothetical protein
VESIRTFDEEPQQDETNSSNPRSNDPNNNNVVPLSPFPQIMSFDAEVNHFQQSPKIRKNPRDAASPRRSRMVVKRRPEYNAVGTVVAATTSCSSGSGSGGGNITTGAAANAANAANAAGIGSTPNNSANAVPLTPNGRYNGFNVSDEGMGSLADAGSIMSLPSLQTEDSRSMGLQYASGAVGDSASLSSSAKSRSEQGTNKTSRSLTKKSNHNVHGHGHGHSNPTMYSPYHQQGAGCSSAAKSQSSNPMMGMSMSTSISTSMSASMVGSSKSLRHVKRDSLDLGQEQILFEQRLCDVNYGVAVRKIHSNGKSQLRYVRCVELVHPIKGVSSNTMTTTTTTTTGNRNNNMSWSVPDVSRGKNSTSSSRSVASLMGRISLGSNRRSNKYKMTNGDGATATIDVDSKEEGTGNHVFLTREQKMKQTMALTWGNKKKVVIPLCNFVEVRKGKTTSRTRKNPCHPSKLLSLLTNDKRHGHGSLDIEAPTKLDRDKFATAFAVFLDIPLKDDFVGEHVNIEPEHENRHGSISEGQIPDDLSSLRSVSTSSSVMTPHGMVEYHIGEGALLPSLSSSPDSSKSSKLMMEKKNISLENSSGNASRSVKSSDSLNDLLRPLSSNTGMKPGSSSLLSDVVKPIPDAKKVSRKDEGEDDDVSRVSSLTQGYDQEIVEELHQAIKELRAELDASRAEAARAVKVAEQAIQSAESCSSNDWNSTVTHKAAEAAAQAQTRSAEALAKQRLAEEKLAAERKSSSFWRKQAQSVQDQAAALQTRLAVAQVQRAAVVEELDREKNKAMTYIKALKQDYSMQESIQRDKIANAAEQNRLLEIELDGTRRDFMAKCEEAKALQDTITEL